VPQPPGKDREFGSYDSVDDFRNFIGISHWRYAKNMPQWPHEYTVRRYEDPEEDQTLFEAAVAFIRSHGDSRKFEPTGKIAVYFDIDGRQYWTMGAPIEKTIIIKPRSTGLENAACLGRVGLIIPLYP
jgi:hypothetical protein